MGWIILICNNLFLLFLDACKKMSKKKLIWEAMLVKICQINMYNSASFYRHPFLTNYALIVQDYLRTLGNAPYEIESKRILCYTMLMAADFFSPSEKHNISKWPSTILPWSLSELQVVSNLKRYYTPWYRDKIMWGKSNTFDLIC